MKRYSLIIIGLLLGVFFLNSCVNEEIVNNGKDGKKTSVKFSFVTPQAGQISTKSLSDYKLVEDLYIFIFDLDGNLDGKGYFSGNQLINGSIEGSIETTTGEHYVYAVANTVNESNTYAIVDDLSDVTTKSQFLTKRARMKNKKLSLTGNIIPMVGVVGNEDGLVNIEPNASLNINLKRIVSSIKFDVSCKSDAGKTATFDLKSYEVVNIPYTSTLVGDNVLNDSNFLSWKEGTISNKENSQSFEFYLLENIKYANNVASYDDREKKENSNVTENIKFRNAPSNSTYIILRGKYKGDANTEYVEGLPNNSKVEADVAYYVHLGNIGEYAPFDYNNFENRRNIEYIYNITITGVDKLIAEVVTDDPYDRGDGVISLETSTFNLDSHYETFNIELNPQISYELSEGSDISWLSFRLFDDDSYTKEKFITQALVPGNEIGTWDEVMKYKIDNETSYNNKLVTGIEGLNDLLSKYRIQNEDATSVKITCYADENVGWGVTSRSVGILSADLVKNGSKLIKEGIILKQEGIRTFFNNSGNGYGVESLNESGRLSTYGKMYTATEVLGDGLFTMKNEVGTTWPTVAEMKKIYAACMSRNRDENGNGQIDSDEMKWYLPAINQYIGMWLGADALADVRLYKLTNRSDKFRYISNTYRNGNKQILWADQGSSTGRMDKAGVTEFPIRCIRNLGNGATPYMFSNNTFTLYLNEEAYRGKQEQGELGNHTHLDDDNKLYKSFLVAENYADGNNKTWYQHNSSANNNKSVCSNYHEGTLKEGYVEYKKIGLSWEPVSTFKYVGTGGTHKISIVGTMVEKYNGTHIEVEAGEAYNDGKTWRLPNQRELSLMFAEKLLTEVHTGCRTWDGLTSDKKSGFGYDGNLRLYGEDYNGSGYLSNTFKIRCVKDVD